MAKGKQMEMFPPPPPTTADLVSARINAARAERMVREATRPGHRHHYRGRLVDNRAELTCPACGSKVSL